MSIDAHGRAHRPAGSPASTGGQFASQAAPGAAATLERRSDAAALSALEERLRSMDDHELGRFRYSPTREAHAASKRAWDTLRELGLDDEATETRRTVFEELGRRYAQARPAVRSMYSERRTSIGHALVATAYGHLLPDGDRDALLTGAPRGAARRSAPAAPEPTAFTVVTSTPARSKRDADPAAARARVVSAVTGMHRMLQAQAFADDAAEIDTRIAIVGTSRSDEAGLVVHAWDSSSRPVELDGDQTRALRAALTHRIGEDRSAPAWRRPHSTEHAAGARQVIDLDAPWSRQIDAQRQKVDPAALADLLGPELVAAMANRVPQTH